MSVTLSIHGIFSADSLQLSRLEVDKRLWNYVERENLWDPNNKGWILCDDKLRKVFKLEKVNWLMRRPLLRDHITRARK